MVISFATPASSGYSDFWRGGVASQPPVPSKGDEAPTTEAADSPVGAEESTKDIYMEKEQCIEDIEHAIDSLSGALKCENIDWDDERTRYILGK